MDANNLPTHALGIVEGFNSSTSGLHYAGHLIAKKPYMRNKIRSFSSISEQGAGTDNAQRHSWPHSEATFKEVFSMPQKSSAVLPLPP